MQLNSCSNKNPLSMPEVVIEVGEDDKKRQYRPIEDRNQRLIIAIVIVSALVLTTGVYLSLPNEASRSRICDNSACVYERTIEEQMRNIQKEFCPSVNCPLL